MASVKKPSVWGFLLLSFSILVFAGCVLGQGEAEDADADGAGADEAGGGAGGAEAAPWPSCNEQEGGHHVLLMVDSPKVPSEVRCGGTLIGQDWVLTAAECQHPKLVALLGQGSDLSKREKFDVKKQYIYKDTKGQHGVMLLHLKRSRFMKFFKISAKYQVLGLPPKDQCHSPQVGATVQMVGYKEAGLAVEPSTFLSSSTTGPTPACVRLSVAECPDFSGYKDKKIELDKAFSYTEMVCAGTESDNTCGGAAGGGMVYNSMVYGVVKGSTKASCSGPIKFTSICPYRDWILKTRGKK